MTFIPQVITNIDSNNSYSSSAINFTGTTSITDGYNTIILTIVTTENSAAGGIQIQFSDDNITFQTFYTDTCFSNITFTKTYLIIKKYYKIIYNGTNLSTLNITSRLSTDLNSSLTTSSNSITIFDNSVETTIDAFNRLRVSMPNTLLDIRFPGQTIGAANFKNNNLQVSSISSGSFTGSYSNSKLLMSGSGSGYYKSQSRNYCVYQPGKSLLFLASGIIYNGPTNSNLTPDYIARIGYFDDNNGLYFQYDSTRGISLNVRSTTTNTIYQADWNIDKMNGSGLSGLTLDFTKAQLFVIDMEWLGVGRVRFGFFAFGKIQYCHQITNINILSNPYTNSINLPIRYELIGNNATQLTSATLTQICSTVISEGGYTPIGKPFCISNDITSITVGTTEVPLLAIRGGGSNYYHENIIPNGISIIDTSTNNNLLYRLRLYLAPNSPGTITWTDVDSNYSVTQYTKSISSFTTTNSIILDQGYFYGRGTIAYNGLGNVFNTLLLQITSNINNVSDIMVLTCQKIGTSTTHVNATISWQEIY
jgi:hypothetical protein